jgi:hypothetical protein
MKSNIAKEVAALRQMTTQDLLGRYAEVFGEVTLTRNKDWLIKRIAWRIQALAEGDLSERARRRIDDLAKDADLRVIAPKDSFDETPNRITKAVPLPTDDRLPAPGTVITRNYKHRVVAVKVLRNGFEHGGEVYPSLSAAAKAITGSHCNGFWFFNLTKGVKR